LTFLPNYGIISYRVKEREVGKMEEQIREIKHWVYDGKTYYGYDKAVEAKRTKEEEVKFMEGRFGFLRSDEVQAVIECLEDGKKHNQFDTEDLPMLKSLKQSIKREEAKVLDEIERVAGFRSFGRIRHLVEEIGLDGIEDWRIRMHIKKRYERVHKPAEPRFMRDELDDYYVTYSQGDVVVKYSR